MIEYFNQPVGSLWEGMGLCLALLGATIIWNIIALGVLGLLGIPTSSEEAAEIREFHASLDSLPLLDRGATLLVFAAIEEVAFRWLPIWFGAWSGYLWITIAASCTVFALSHGRGLHVFVFQGVSGLAYSVCFLKLAGGETAIANGSGTMWLAFVGCTIVHCAFNLIMLGLSQPKTKKLTHA